MYKEKGMLAHYWTELLGEVYGVDADGIYTGWAKVQSETGRPLMLCTETCVLQARQGI